MERRKINFHSNNTESYNQLFTMTELKTSLRKSHNTTIGPDEIPYEFLKQLPKISLQYLLQIFNNIWHSGNISNSCKQNLQKILQIQQITDQQLQLAVSAKH